MVPKPKQKRTHWDSIAFCSPKCSANSRKNYIPVRLDPEAQHTVGMRLRWLRLCKSPGGGKDAISKEAMAFACHVSDGTVDQIERGIVEPHQEYIDKACAYLKINPALLTTPTARFAKLVSKPGLVAYAPQMKPTENQ
jgi:DNA-binding XRE family transcriptional regulator